MTRKGFIPMTSTDLQAQLDQLDQEIEAFEKALSKPQNSLNTAIDLEDKLTSRKRIRDRLHRQLSEALAQEKTVQEKRIRAGLETELSELESRF
jgi:multidrug resistance efflux pump